MMSPEALRILTRAYEVIRVRKNWTKGVLVRDRKTREDVAIEDANPTTCQFCALGVLEWSTRQEGLRVWDAQHDEARDALTECAAPLLAQPKRVIDPVISVNDSKGHAKVVEAFECAIKKASA